MATVVGNDAASQSHPLRNVIAGESVDSISDAGGNGDDAGMDFHSLRDDGDSLRRHLKYFFMNPCQKYRAKRKTPYKLILQIVKVVLVTVQLVMFGVSRASHVDFLEKSNVAFKHLYLKDWTASYETMPYPPSTGVFAVYTIGDFYASVNFALSQYNRTELIAIGTYNFANDNNTMQAPELCQSFYRAGRVFAFNRSYDYDPTVMHKCIAMEPINGVYDAEKYLKSINESINFDGLITAELSMSVRTVHLKSLSQLSSPDCYQFDIKIKYDNADHNGQMAVELKSPEQVLLCNGTVNYQGVDNVALVAVSIFDVVVVITSFASIFLCGRSIVRAAMLGKETATYFASSGRQPLHFSEKLEFVNFWYLMIIVNDFLTIAGCIVKIRIENKFSVSYEVCGVLLGTANLLVWCGLLRYLGFFHKYNILIRTIKQSAPNVLRFLICAFVFYFGFAICGWVVLGPYHLKFRQLSTSSECLFSLINGDDIFTTFATTSEVNSVMWWYSRLYLYFFISLFIYVILSVFISVIMDTYETIKREYAVGVVKDRLHAFADECTDDPHELFADQHTGCPFSSCASCLTDDCCGRIRGRSRSPVARTIVVDEGECSPLLS